MKKYLLGFLIGCVGLINFGFTGQLNLVSKPYVDAGKIYAKFSPSSLNVYTGFNFIDDMLFYNCSHTGAGEYCYIRFSYKTNGSLKYCYLYYNQNGDGQLTHSNCNFDTDSQTITFSDCDNYSSNVFHCFDYIGYNFDYSQLYSSSCPECQECSEVNTGEILSGYILESEVDTNYCVNNDLCPVYENNSLLYINTIEHQSAPVINIDIPLEYERDSSIDSGTFNLVISGNNVDYDYIDGIITTQNSKPSSEDFNKIITVLLPVFIPGLVIILFLFFIFKFIKKVF